MLILQNRYIPYSRVFFIASLLNRCPPGNIFIVLCFLVRGMEALALSANITAIFAIASNEFPKNIATVFVSLFLISIHNINDKCSIHYYIYKPIRINDTFDAEIRV